MPSYLYLYLLLLLSPEIGTFPELRGDIRIEGKSTPYLVYLDSVLAPSFDAGHRTSPQYLLSKYSNTETRDKGRASIVNNPARPKFGYLYLHT